VLTCSKFLTTSDYAPCLRARQAIEQQLIDDATARGWQREIANGTLLRASASISCSANSARVQIHDSLASA
jgi:hypothetical protein